MASGLPIITPKVGDWGKMIEERDCGVALENGSVEEYLDALNVLALKNAWMKKSQNAITAINEKYSWSITLKPLLDLLAAYN